MKISLDVMGGDYAPDVNTKGAQRALTAFPEIEKIYLVGREWDIKASCDRIGLKGDRVEIVPASEVVEMNESGIMAVRKKRDASISVAVDLVKQGEAQAVVGAGNTGAAVAAATIKLRLLNGVERAGIATQLPNEYGVCNLMDAGANPDARPSHLVGYAIMASVLARHIYGKENPRVGIMSNGEEDEKGNEFSKATFKLMKVLMEDKELPFNFVGNVEGHDLFEHELDVALTDGFTGNILLKTCEATAKAFGKWLKEEIKKSPVRMAGAMLTSGAFKAMKRRLSYDAVGGSPLLGVNGLTIIAHGGSNDTAIFNALRVAQDMYKNRINPIIEEEMDKLGNVSIYADNL